MRPESLSRSSSATPSAGSARVVRTLALALALSVSLAGSARAVLPGQISLHPAYPSWLFYHQVGPYFLAGPGDPEGFLYRGTRNADGTRDGDQDALIDKLAPTGANSIYLMAVRSHGGDGDSTQNPFIDSDPANGLSEPILDQWRAWFERMDEAGITIFLFLYDDGSLLWNTGDAVGAEERQFIQALVDRFEHLQHLVWVVAEEYQERYSAARVSAIAAELKAADDHDHPVAVHKLSGLVFDEFADDPALDQFAIQYNVPSADQLHAGVALAWDDAAGRYNLNLAEAADWGAGAESRQKAWAAAMAGAYVMVYQMDIAGTDVADLEDLGRLRAFMESTDFYRMAPRDDLADGDTEYVLAREAKSYLVYARAGSGALGLTDFFAGTYRLRWLDIAGGLEVVEDGVEISAGAQAWPRPAGVGAEAVVYALRLDGPNDPPEVLDQSLIALDSAPLALRLGFLDPDGPGPHVYTIESAPQHGTLDGTPPDLLYTPDPGFAGTDLFTWKVSDGVDASETASVTLMVSVNQPPTATDFTVTGVLDTPLTVPFDAHAADPEGQELTFVIVEPPGNGALDQIGAEWIYTPDAGFAGIDRIVWQADDGGERSEPATASLRIAAPIFADDFDRADSDEVGNGWVEIEIDGQAAIAQQTLAFDSVDESDRPLVRRAFSRQSAGVLTWNFELGFERTGSEGSYAFHMQLGDGALMSDGAPDAAGVAVNLLWGGPNVGFSGHERLGHLVDGLVTELATVSGAHELTVEVDVDLSRYAVRLDGALLATDIPFDDAVAIDTLRLFADGLNAQNFQSRWVDAVRIEAPCSAPDGDSLVLSDDLITDARSYWVCDRIDLGPNWTVAAPGDVTLEAGGSVVFGNGVEIGAGARLTIYAGGN